MAELKKRPGKKAVSKKTSKYAAVKKTTTRSKAAKKSAKKAAVKSEMPDGAQCITVCSLEDGDNCVEICTTPEGDVVGDIKPCEFCGSGHFCDNDFECLSCGLKRGCKVLPYKGW